MLDRKRKHVVERSHTVPRYDVVSRDSALRPVVPDIGGEFVKIDEPDIRYTTVTLLGDETLQIRRVGLTSAFT